MTRYGAVFAELGNPGPRASQEPPSISFVGLGDELNRFLTGRNPQKFNQFVCPRCGKVGTYNNWRNCTYLICDCKCQFGADPDYVYFRCICGNGVFAIEATQTDPVESFHFQCDACRKLMFVSEPSASLCAIGCLVPTCGTARYMSLLEFQNYLPKSRVIHCGCGRRIKPPLSKAGQEFRLRCPSCSQIREISASYWKTSRIDLGCGHMAAEPRSIDRCLPNVIDRVESAALSVGMHNEMEFQARNAAQTVSLQRRLGEQSQRITYRRVVVTDDGMIAEELIVE